MAHVVDPLRGSSGSLAGPAPGAGSPESSADSLRALAEHGEKVALLFGAQGTECAGFAAELYRRSAPARDTFRRCERAVRHLQGTSLLHSYLFETHETDPGLVQPAVTAFQLAVSRNLREAGLPVDFVAGLCGGEIAAAEFTGALRLEDAMRVACRVSALAARIPPTGLLARLDLGWSETAAAIAAYRGVSAAVAMNPSTTIVSGIGTEIRRLVRDLAAVQVTAAVIPARHAYHTSLIGDLRPWFVQGLADIRPRAVSSRFRSPKPLTDDLCSPEWWWRMCVDPILFAPLLDAFIDQRVRHFVEVSPRPMLAASIRAVAAVRRVPVTVWSVTASTCGELAAPSSPPSERARSCER